MNQGGILHPKLFDVLEPNLFRSTCAIYPRVATRNVISEDEYTYPAVLPGHDALRCYKSRYIGQMVEQEENRRPDIVGFDSKLETLMLDGYYPDVTDTMRAVVDGVTWDIKGVIHAGAKIHTKLTIELVK